MATGPWRHWSLTSSSTSGDRHAAVPATSHQPLAPAFISSPLSSAASFLNIQAADKTQELGRWREGQLGGKLKVFSMKCGVPRPRPSPRPRPGAGQLANGVTVSAGRSANDRRDTVTRQTRPAAAA